MRARRSRNVGVALIGLLVVAAISVAAGSGRKPEKEQQVAVSSRHISTSEAMEILRKFPALIPDFLAKRKDDAEYMAGTFGFVEVTIAPLARIFPTARFYRGHDFYSPPHPYLMAIEGNKGYSMPYGFNRLLIDNGLKVTDKNIIELAKAFVTAAIGEGFPKVTFLQATRTKQVIDGRLYSVRLEIQTDEQIEEWFFSLSYWHDQFGTVDRRGPHGYIDSYNPATEWPSPGQRQSNSRPPIPAVEAIRAAVAQAERDSLGTELEPGSEPEKGQEVKVSLRRLSANEVMDILRKFPEIVPSYMAAEKDDAAYLTSAFDFSEVKAARLEEVFPTARFYKGLDFRSPPAPYLMAVVGNKRYWLPGQFNQLLLDNGLQVTDRNIIELAKTFVLLAAGSQPVYGNAEFGGASGDELASFPQVTFLGGRRIEEYDRQSATAMDVEVICRIDSGETQTWKLSQSRRFPRKSTPVKLGQFERALVFADGKPARLYRVVKAGEEKHTGAPDPTPNRLEQQK